MKYKILVTILMFMMALTANATDFTDWLHEIYLQSEEINEEIDLGLSTYMSIQVGSSPANGYILQTDGTDSTWIDSSSISGVQNWELNPSGNLTPTTTPLTVEISDFQATSTTATSTIAAGLTIASSAGNVGIATTAPAHTLDVCGTMQSDTLRITTMQAKDDNSIYMQPDGDTDDYFTFKSPSDRPTLKREGGKYIYIESSNVNDMGISMREDATYSGTLQFAKDVHEMGIIGKGVPFVIKVDTDYDDYFKFTTANNIPELTIASSTAAKINAGGTNPLLLNHAGGNVGIGTTSPNVLLTVGSTTPTTVSGYRDAFFAGDVEIDGTLTLDTALADGMFTKTGDWTGTFDGQEGSYYLDADNLTNYGNQFYTFFNATNTDALSEGSTNLYWTNDRFDVRLTATTTLPALTTLANLTTVGTIGTGVWEGTAIGDAYLTKSGDWTGTFDGQEGSYYLDANNLTDFGTPFYTYFNATNTDALSEGSSNLYWTDNRFDVRLTATTTLPAITTLANLSITESQVSDLTHYTDTDWDERMTGTTTLPTITTLAGLTTFGASGATTTNNGNLAITGYLDINGASATNTMATGIDIATGCFAVNGTCVTAGGWDSIDDISLTKGNFIVGNDAGTAQATSTIFIDSTGKVGIGTVSPGAKLEIHAPTNDYGLFIREDTDDTLTHNFYIDNSDNGAMKMYSDGQSIKILLNTAGDSYLNGGNVGIGSTSPSQKLVVNGIVQVLNQLRSTSGNDLYLNANSANRDIFMQVNGTTLMTVQGSTGNVGIGTTTPDNTLHVYKASAGSTTGYSEAPLVVENNTTNYLQFLSPNNTNAGLLFGDPESNLSGRVVYNHTDNNMKFWINAGTRMTIDSAGNVGIGTTTPESKLALELTATAGTIDNIYDYGGNRLHLDATGVNSTETAITYYGYTAGYETLGGGAAIGFGRGASSWDTYMAFYTNTGTSAKGQMQEQMRIQPSGNVGIGTTSPAAILEIAAASEADFYVTDTTNTARVRIGTGDTLGVIGTQSNHDLRIRTNNTDRMTIDTSGNVGIGDTTPESTIDAIGVYSDTVGATNRDLYIDNAGVIGYVSSSGRYKENIRSLDEISNKIFQLNPVLFDYKDSDKGFNQVGLIAEEVHEVLPEIVSYDLYEYSSTSDHILLDNYDNKNDYLSIPYNTPTTTILCKEEVCESKTIIKLAETVSYDKIEVLLLNELIKQKNRADALEVENNTLKTKHLDIETRMSNIESSMMLGGIPMQEKSFLDKLMELFK